MNYLILHYFFLVCIYSRRISAHSISKTNRFDIDDFINQLLSSQKFDELADKVADKAVKKIKNLDPSVPIDDKHPVDKHSSDVEFEHRGKKHFDSEHDRTRNRDSNEEEDEKKKVISNESNEEPKSKKERNNEYNTKEVKTRDREAPVVNENPNIIQEKINTQALMKNDDDSSQAELSLKYKHFKKHVPNEKGHNHQNTDSNEHSPWKHLEHPKLKQRHNDDVEEKERVEQDTASSERNTKRGKRNKPTTTNNQNGYGSFDNKEQEKGDHDQNSRPRFKAGQATGLPVIDLDKNNDKVEKQQIKEQPSQSSTKNNDMIWRANYQESQISDSDESEDVNQQTSGKAPGYKPGELTTSKKSIRREGDRYYAYLSAPEYAEFHEQLAKQESNKGDQLY